MPLVLGTNVTFWFKNCANTIDAHEYRVLTPGGFNDEPSEFLCQKPGVCLTHALSLFSFSIDQVIKN